MKFIIKVPAVGTFEGSFPSSRAASAWAEICYPLAWPASVLRKVAT